MSDLFQEGIPWDFVTKIWHVMASANWHTYQILTKRPENMLRVIEQQALPVLENVWLGTSVESGEYTIRIDYLREVPAVIGPVNGFSLERIDWAIVGGESGPSCRPILAEWVEDILEACKMADCAFFFKQWGGSNKKKTGRMFLGRTWDEYPGKLLGSGGSGL
jgi:protein gp37